MIDRTNVRSLREKRSLNFFKPKHFKVQTLVQNVNNNYKTHHRWRGAACAECMRTLAATTDKGSNGHEPIN